MISKNYYPPMSDTSYLALNQQLCFPMYATSRLITRLYQPLLEKLSLTYPQYLVMLVLWEEEKASISHLGSRLFLKTNTLTPLLKKMKDKGFISKERATEDERTVYIQLTEIGKTLKQQAELIPLNLLKEINLPLDELEQMRNLMWKFLESFDDQKLVSDTAS